MSNLPKRVLKDTFGVRIIQSPGLIGGEEMGMLIEKFYRGEHFQMHLTKEEVCVIASAVNEECKDE
jgi:hypothetical protein